MNKDLTVGNPHKVLWLFCLPLFVSMIFQQLYNIADSLVAGKFISELALAAVGNGYEITLVFIAFAFGCNIGCSVIISKLFGQKKFSELKTSVYTTFIASSVLCIVLVTIGLLVLEPVLHLIKTPDNIYEDSLLYLQIYLYGFPFVLFYNVATGIFSALGDSKTPLIFLTCSSLANIGVDILFVTQFNMGVAGVAWATFICQGISCILSIIVVFLRFRKLPHEGKAKIFSWQLLGQISVIAIPSVLQQTFISVGNIIIQGLVNPYGSEVIAGYSAAIKLNNLVIASIVTVGNGISNYTAQNIGANKLDRISKGYKAGILMVLTICLPLVLTYFFAGRYLVAFFIDNPSEVALETGEKILQILSPFYFVVSTKLVADGILRGSNSMVQFMIATFIDLIIRVALAYILIIPLETIGIWIAFPIGWCISAVVSFCFYYFNKKIHLPKEKKLIEKEA